MYIHISNVPVKRMVLRSRNTRTISCYSIPELRCLTSLVTEMYVMADWECALMFPECAHAFLSPRTSVHTTSRSHAFARANAFKLVAQPQSPPVSPHFSLCRVMLIFQTRCCSALLALQSASLSDGQIPRKVLLRLTILDRKKTILDSLEAKTPQRQY